MMRASGLLLLLAAVGGVAAAPRVALQVDTPSNEAVPTGALASASEWHAVLTAELARRHPAVELVERSELARLWTERETTAAAASAPLSVDHYLHFRRVAPARWIVESVDAATGRALGSFAVDAADLSAASASRLAEAAARLLSAPVPADPNASAPRLAVVESADAAGDAALFSLAARLRAALADEGLVILDRSLTQEIAIEQNDAARGFRAAPPAAALLGLDFYLELSARDARLVRVRDGVVAGVRPRSGPDPDEVNTLQRWALPLLDRSTASTTDYLPEVEVEALEPFFHGLAHHDAGRFPDAIAEFTRAYELNGRFRDAYEWSARCHEALDLPEVAAAIRRFLASEFLENISAPTGRLAPVDGIAFLGVGGPALPSSLRESLAAGIASALSHRAELGLRLPAEIARLRDEHDWALLGAAPGKPAPALFTRRILTAEASLTETGLSVVFTLRDALGVAPPQRYELLLDTDPALRAATLGAFLAAWPPVREPDPKGFQPAPAAAALPPDSANVEVLAADVAATASESLADPARLRLLLADPAHPLAVVRRSPAADEPLASFLEHGRRAEAVRRLPPASPARRWLELLRALEHLDPLGPGPLYSGGRLDARAELARLATVVPEDGPGLVARYHLLWFAQASLPPAELAAAAEALRTAAAARPDHVADCHLEFDLALAALARLARLASTPGPEDLLALDKFTAPTDLPAFRFSSEGRLACFRETYAIMRRTFAGLDPADATANARALLALNGRAHARDSYTPALLAAHPRAPALLQFVILRLSQSLAGAAMPREGMDDWAARRALARAGLAHAVPALEQAYASQTSPDALNTTNLLATALLGVLGHHRLREWMPPDAHADAHARLCAAESKARARISFPHPVNPNALHLPALTPPAVRAILDDDLRSSGVWIGNPEPIRARLLSRESAFSAPGKESTRRSWWWLAARWETEEAFTAEGRAALLSRPLDAILRSASPDPDEARLSRHFDLGLFLLQGRRHAEAERILGPLAALPVPAGAPRPRRVFVANALFRLAQIQHHAGRLPEALATAREGLALADGHSLPYLSDGSAGKNTEAILGAKFLRLLAELRHDPDRLPLPPRIGFVRVATPNGDNPRLIVYYRLPPPLATASDATRASPPHVPRVLVLSTVANTEPLEILATPGPWTDFADTHGLVLVAPRFHVSDGVDRGEHLFTHARFAGAWSGEALLRAVDEISRRTPVAPARMFVYGHASGTGFASHFAAWRPDRVAALALAQGNWGLANQPLPGFAPLAALVSVPHWIGANPHDNYQSRHNSPRHAYVRDFASRLRNANVPLEWEESPAPSNTPSPALEQGARAFLARQLSSR